MDQHVNRQVSRLPSSFPVGTTYVVEGRSGKEGMLRVFSRYVVLPSGRRINVAPDLDAEGSVRPASRRGAGADAGKRRNGRTVKKFSATGTTPRHRR